MGGERFFSANYHSHSLSDYEFSQKLHLTACCPHSVAQYNKRKLVGALQIPGKPKVDLSNLVAGTGRTKWSRDVVHSKSTKNKHSMVYKRTLRMDSRLKHVKQIQPPTALGLSADQSQTYKEERGERWALHVREKPSSALFASSWTRVQSAVELPLGVEPV